jgi:DNA-binding NarL/FixJ family response regulator
VIRLCLNEGSFVRHVVLIVDRNPVFSAALCRLLEGHGHRALAASPERADLEAAAHGPEVLLLDGDMDPVDVAVTAAVVKREVSGVRTVLLVGASPEPLAALAREVGALGWVSRQATGDALQQAVLRAASGRRLANTAPAPRSGTDGGQPALQGLTERELLVLRALMGGMRSNGIADLLGISRHTVRTHVQSILGKLAVHTRLEAGMVGLQAGLSPLSRPRTAVLSRS